MTYSPTGLFDLVARRDEYHCVAPVIDRKAGWCRDRWGHVITRWPSRLDRDKLTFAHVKDPDGQSMGKKAPTNAWHLLLLCWGHHEGTGPAGSVWGTSRDGLDLQRRYLAKYAPIPRNLP